MPERIFVTGTDTGVGKTVVSTILARGLGAYYWKPVQTGEIRDAEFVGRWIGTERIIPEAHCFPAPLSPHAAAQLAGERICVDEILQSQPSSNIPLVIEGAGGVLVPLNAKERLVDLMKALAAPVVVVARTSLGTINHTLLTLEALRRRSIEIHSVVLIGRPNVDNFRAIEKFGEVRVLGPIPWCSDFSDEWLRTSFTQISVQGEFDAVTT